MTTGYHEVHLPEDPARRMVWQVLTEYLAQWVPADAHVVEIGAAYCYWINGVRAARKVAVDVWPGFLRFAGPGVDATILDAATALRTLGEQRFDVAMASNVLEHFEPDVAASVVGDVAALLRPGGRFIVIQPNFRYAYREYYDDYTHRAVFTDTSLSNLLRSYGFHIEASVPRFLPYSMRETRWPIRPWLVRAYLKSPIRPRAGQMLVVARKD